MNNIDGGRKILIIMRIFNKQKKRKENVLHYFVSYINSKIIIYLLVMYVSIDCD